jgi:hypothetical protein
VRVVPAQCCTSWQLAAGSWGDVVWLVLRGKGRLCMPHLWGHGLREWQPDGAHNVGTGESWLMWTCSKLADAHVTACGWR